jgi:hypothetical protein
MIAPRAMLGPNQGHNALKIVRFRVARCRDDHFGLFLSIHALKQTASNPKLQRDIFLYKVTL